MNNEAFLPLFQATFSAVNQTLATWDGDLMHSRLLDHTLSKLRDDFMSDKVFPALMGPLLAYQCFKPINAPFHTLAAAQILFYAFLDITDDVEDQDLAGTFWDKAGEPLAINAGSSLLFLSLLSLKGLKAQGISTKKISHLQGLFQEAGWWLTVGQHRDLYSRQEKALSPEACLKTMRLKTGTSVGLYFESACFLAGGSPKDQALFVKIGQTLGTMMQVRSDYLNVMEQDSSDLKNRQFTLPLAYLHPQLTPKDQALFEVCLNQLTTDPASHTLMRHLLKKYKVKDLVNQCIHTHRESLSSYLSQLKKHSSKTQDLERFINRIKPL